MSPHTNSINFAWEYGWRKLWIESDSLFAINLFNSNSLKVPWKLRNDWERAVFLASKMIVHYTHIFREANCCAN